MKYILVKLKEEINMHRHRKESLKQNKEQRQANEF